MKRERRLYVFCSEAVLYLICHFSRDSHFSMYFVSVVHKPCEIVWRCQIGDSQIGVAGYLIRLAILRRVD